MLVGTQACVQEKEGGWVNTEVALLSPQEPGTIKHKMYWISQEILTHVKSPWISCSWKELMDTSHLLPSGLTSPYLSSPVPSLVFLPSLSSCILKPPGFQPSSSPWFVLPPLFCPLSPLPCSPQSSGLAVSLFPPPCSRGF